MLWSDPPQPIKSIRGKRASITRGREDVIKFTLQCCVCGRERIGAGTLLAGKIEGVARGLGLCRGDPRITCRLRPLEAPCIGNLPRIGPKAEQNHTSTQGPP